MTSRGVLYISSDDSYLNEAVQSARQVKSVTDIDTGLITDAEDPPNIFDEVVTIGQLDGSFADKPKYIAQSPFDRTLYLDTDIYLVSPSGVTDIFDALDYVDIAISFDSSRISDHPLFDPPNITQAIPMLNTGVIGFNDTRSVQNLFAQWKKLYQKKYDNISGPDQPPFRKALAKSEIRYHVLPPEYNFNISEAGILASQVKILHGECRNHKELAELLNKRPNRVRSYQPFYTDSSPPSDDRRVIPRVRVANEGISPTRFTESVKEIGFLKTLATYPLGGPSIGRARMRLIRRKMKKQGLGSTLKFVFKEIR